MFSAETRVQRAGPGDYAATVGRDWWVFDGPNGGYLAAVVLRAVLAELDDPARPPRWLTLHYLAPPAPGAVRIEVTVERVGRSLSTASARVTQGGEPLVLALAALASPGRRDRDFSHADMPAVSPPAEAIAVPHDPMPPYSRHYDMRVAAGGWPFRGEGEASTAVWLRSAAPDPVDACLLAALTDAWIPAVFMRLEGPAAVPTIALTIHFREPLAAGVKAGDWVLGQYRSAHAHEGFIDEESWIWSTRGVLLAQSRQLAVLT